MLRTNGKAPGGQLSVRFNQDFTRMAVGLKDGFEIWDLHPLHMRFKRSLGKADHAGVDIVEPLYRTNVVAIVGGGDKPLEPPRKVFFWDDRVNNYIAELSYNAEIRNVRLRRDRIFVVLENSVFVYLLKVKNLEPMDTVSTVHNPRGIIAVSSSDDAIVFACPGKVAGNVYVENSTAGTKRSIIAHLEAEGLGALALSQDGLLLATTDLDGKEIHVYDTATGREVASFRRGSQSAVVNSLCFSPDSRWICISTSRGTVHIFGLGDPADAAAAAESAAQASKAQQSSLSFLGSMVPTSLGGSYLNAKWSFAQIRVTEPNSICCFGETSDIILVASAGGLLGRYRFDTQIGGEGKLIEEKKYFA